MRSKWVRLGTLLITLIAAAGCSDSTSSVDSDPTIGPTTSTIGIDDPGALPRVELIREAVTALETQLGGPQDYFEINATSSVVNLFVALNNGAIAQPWVYLDGELSSTEGQPADGNTFRADALTFDSDTLLTKVAEQLPKAALDAVEILGGPNGAVQYTVIVTSTNGGQLLVVVGPDGAVISVDPV